MHKETKVGLLVGLCFIACFAVLLSHRSQPGIDPDDAAFEISTILRGSPAEQSVPQRQATRTKRSTSGEQGPNDRKVQPQVDPPRESLRANRQQTDPFASRSQAVADAASYGSTSEKDVAASGLQGPLWPDMSAWSRFRNRRPPIEGPRVTGNPADDPLDNSVALVTRGFQEQPAAPASKAILEQAQVLETALNPVPQPDRRSHAMMLTGRRQVAKSSATKPRTPRKTYVVQSGDTLSRIARKHYGSAAEKTISAIYNANRDLMASPDHIVVGSRIELPDMTAADPPDTRNVESGNVSKPATRKKDRKRNRGQEGVDWKWYQIKKGDVLSKVASEQLGTAKRWRELAEMNADIFPDAGRIRSGVQIRIPINRFAATTNRAESEGIR